jgi:hypothetical protein
LLTHQAAIETALARRHLQNGTLVLYDVSSSYMEGRCCPLAKRGYSRDGKKGTLQIVYGIGKILSKLVNPPRRRRVATHGVFRELVFGCSIMAGVRRFMRCDDFCAADAGAKRIV